MDTKKQQQQADISKSVSAILREGVDFLVTVDNPTILHRLGIIPSVRKFMVYPAKLGALFYISKIIMEMEEADAPDDGDMFVTGIKNVIANKDKMVEMLAIGILNRPLTGIVTRLKKWWMQRYLNKNLDPEGMLRLIQLIIMQMDVTRFLASTASIKRLNLTGAGSEKETEPTTGKSSEAS